MPPNLLEAAEQDGRLEWLATLPTVVPTLCERWRLDLDAPFQPGGQTAWVAPARRDGQDDLVLKVGWRHPEAEHEAEGLQVWDGEGAVRLHAVDRFGDTIALLLERCVPGTTLSTRPEPEQDTVVAGLLHRLWRKEPPPHHSFPTLQAMCDTWADEFERKDPAASAPKRVLDPGLARDGIALFRTLPATAEREVLLCTDLHAGNVLAARRKPWLVIDPKPHLGDPTYDPLQHMLNCEERLQADPCGLTHRMADLLELDRERLLRWLFARCVQESPGWPGLADVARRIAPA